MGKGKKSAPALTPEAREAQLINLAMRQAEEQLLSGTASSQVITHFLRLGTEKSRLERAKLEAESNLAKAKVEAIRSQQTSEEMYQNALRAFSTYSGTSESVYGEEDFDDYYDE